MIGAREAREVAFLNPLRSMINRASAQHLHALVVPGPEVALAAGLDLRAAGLTLAAGPRQANVLLLLTPLSDKMLAAASVAYAQMPRPRMVLVLGDGSYAPLPKADATAPLTPEGLKQAVGTLRQIMSTQGFAAKVEDFDAPSLQSRIEYTCPMHPEIVQDEPGSCPKCGMFLVPKETSATPETHDHAAMATPEPAHEADGAADKTAKYTCPMHPEVTSDTPGNCPKCGMNLVKPEEATNHSHHHASHAPSEDAATYVCPMHPEVTSHEPGSCPKCGMFLEEVKDASSEGHHDHAEQASAAKYTCPMHPEVVNDEAGSCPKCGMFLEEVKEAGGEGHHGHDHTGHASGDTPAKYTCPMHPEVTSDAPGNCPKCGMNLIEAAEEHEDGPHDHATMAAHAPSASVSSEESPHAAHGSSAKYTCPMHPEVTSDAPGNCPKCGMNLVKAEHAESGHAGGHDHGGGSTLLDGLNGLEPGFMSMIEMTDGTPRSSNGLQMEWITTPFGPFFPGLPGGLTLELELDGDTVVSAKTGSLTGPQDLLQNGPRAAAEYAAALGAQMPLATVAYQLLACRAIESAAKVTPSADIKIARSAALARERITSHLLWLSQLGRQLGLKGIEREAATLHLLVHAAAPEAITALGPRLNKLAAKARRTWFLSRRLATVGTLPPEAVWDGPTSADTTAAGRLAARLAEISSSLSEVAKATSLTPPTLADIGNATGTGHASVQTARGLASLQVELRKGAVVSATLETPSSRHVSLVNPLIEQQELADALVAIASLDLSPWELPA